MTNYFKYMRNYFFRKINKTAIVIENQGLKATKEKEQDFSVYVMHLKSSLFYHTCQRLCVFFLYNCLQQN